MADFGIALFVMVAVVVPLMVWAVRADRHRRREADERTKIGKEEVA